MSLYLLLFFRASGATSDCATRDCATAPQAASRRDSATSARCYHDNAGDSGEQIGGSAFGGRASCRRRTRQSRWGNRCQRKRDVSIPRVGGLSSPRRGRGDDSARKEVVIKAGSPFTTELALSAAPEPPEPEAPPPPPPPPPPPAEAPRGVPVSLLSIVDLAERSLDGRDAIKMVAIGCSGLGTAQLTVVRETIPATVNEEADLMMYLFAGEANAKMGDKDQPLTPGWFRIVPRGTRYTVTRKGRSRHPAVGDLGPPCQSATTSR